MSRDQTHALRQGNTFNTGKISPWSRQSSRRYYVSTISSEKVLNPGLKLLEKVIVISTTLFWYIFTSVGFTLLRTF